MIFEGVRNGNAVKSSFLIRLDDVGVLRDKCPKESHYAETVAGRLHLEPYWNHLENFPITRTSIAEAKRSLSGHPLSYCCCK